MVAFATHCPLLEELHISSCQRVTDAGMLAVANKRPRLRILKVSYCEGVTDLSLVELAQCCPNLAALDLHKSYAGNNTVLAVAEHCPGLLSLVISGRPKSLEEHGQGRGNPDSETGWEGIRERTTGLAAVLRNFLQLEVLEVSGCQGLSDAGLRMEGGSCQRLRKLKLQDCHGCFTDQGLAAMPPIWVPWRY
eukprot:jgi/Mesvir1/20922/Mv07993-RA.1